MQVCRQEERSPALTPSSSHPIPAGLSPCLAARSPQSPAQHTPDSPLSRGRCSVPARGVGLGGDANPVTWLKVQGCLPVRPPREEMGRRMATTTCCPTFAPYYLPNNPCPRKAELALALPVASPSVSSRVDGPRGYLPGTDPGVHAEILSSSLQMSLENNNSFLNPRKEKSTWQDLTFCFWLFSSGKFNYDGFIGKQSAHPF